MKWKKFLSAALAAALILSLAAPASAEPPVEEAGTDGRLAQVTLKVKNTLGIGDSYTEFHGNLWENELVPIWNLEWSGETGSLNVEAIESGKIVSYYRHDGDVVAVSSQGGFAPAFPAITREQARQAAEEFVSKVLDASLESAVFSEGSSARLNTAYYRFQGEIRLHGLPAPLSFSVSVRSSDGAVTSFHRDILEGNTVGGVPAAKPAASQGAAGALLKGTLSLRLEYVLDREANKAVLRYLPQYGDEFFVDAQTGKLVNLSELYRQASKGEFGGGSNGAAPAPDAAPELSEDSAAGDKLSQTELEGIAKLEGVLSKEELDARLRGVAALGLDKYALGSASYSLNQDTGEVTVRIHYSRKDSDGIWRRDITCDGKTGALLEVSSNAPYSDSRRVSVSADKARQTAEAFLASLWGEQFGRTVLYDSVPLENGRWDASHSFTYAQQEHGYFFLENTLSVSVDATDGSISGLNRCWTEVDSFDSPEGIVDMAAALNAWFNHYDVALAYRNIPVRLDPNTPGAAPLMELGYSYFYGLTLSYALESDAWASGVDARTGEVITETRKAAAGLAYDDLEGCWGRAQAEKLASYGVGWLGGSLEPSKELSQLDLVALLISTQGYLYDPAGEEADSLYQQAYRLGLLTKEERDDGKVLTRAETVKILLDAAGYGRAARLEGIYRCSFADEGEIPAGCYGYAAIAQALGIVSGDSANRFAPNRAATRLEALIMLYNYMSAPQ